MYSDPFLYLEPNSSLDSKHSVLRIQLKEHKVKIVLKHINHTSISPMLDFGEDTTRWFLKK